MARKGFKKVESHGVEVQVSRAVLDDARFAYCIGKVQRISKRAASLPDGEEKDAVNAEAMEYYMDMLDIIFGDGVMKVLDELAAANGGTVTNEEFGEFLNDVVGAIAKNS